ncbi:MAG: 50S ribosomal protein L25 [Planctomycetes bacterium]|nr:50S ribosomal protein L25 [Planctomycetota bacterium]
MAETFSLKAEERKEFGTRPSRRFRVAGKVPAVLSHKTEKPVNLLVGARELLKIIEKRARIIDLAHPAGKDKVFIKEVQWDHLGERLVHVDFTKVARDEVLTLEVPLELKGKPVGVSEEGGVLDQYVKILKIQCLPDAIPEKIEVEVTHLKKDEQLHVKDVKAPAGVKILQDPELTVAAVTEHKVEEVAPAAATPGPAEPDGV